MKKVVIILLVLITLLILIQETNFTTKAIIDIKSVFDIKAVSSLTTNVSVQVISDTTPPAVKIYYPTNSTINTLTNINLNFSATDTSLDKIWYNLDGGTNITITQNTTFNSSMGIHTLYLFANDTQNNMNNSEKVNFVISPNWLNWSITMTEFNLSSTNFANFNSSTQWNISNLELHVGFGSIEFLKNINISDHFDFDKYINITNNFIFLDSNYLTIFNTSTELTLYNLTFTNPRIVKDGIVCPATICTKISYSGGTLKFNVTSFSSYSGEETPSSGGGSGSGSGSGGSGGGIGSTVTEPPSFTTNIDNLQLSLKQGESKKEFLTIKNNKDTTITVNINIESIKDLVFLPGDLIQSSLIIPANSEESLQLIFNIPIDQEPDLYIGSIDITSGPTTKTIKTIIEVESAKPLFDVYIEIKNPNKLVAPGELLIANTKIFNLGDYGRYDVEINYTIKDYDGKGISQETETAAIETSVNLIREFLIPTNTKLGTYIIYVTAKYNNSIGSSSSLFEVTKIHLEEPLTKSDFYITLFILIIIISLIITYLFIEAKKHKEYHKITNEDLYKYFKRR